MKRFNLYLEEKWIDKLKKEKKDYGFSSIASFIRYIIIKFFEKR